MSQEKNKRKIEEMVQISEDIDVNPKDYEMSISNDGRHLLCRFPIDLINGFNLVDEQTDETNKEKTRRLKLSKKWKIVFKNIDFENKKGDFEIKEK